MKIDFIGVGFGRTGSNWLCNCLYEHPKISIPKFNLHTEINYFPEEYEVMGLKNYYKKFKDCDFSKVVGEISTMVIMYRRSAKILKKLFPNVKIIIYTRKEKDRARSVFNIRKHHDLLNVQEEFINQKEYIKPWLDIFGDNVFIFDMDHSNKQDELNRLFEFLGIGKFKPSYLYKRPNTSYADPIKKIPISNKHPITTGIINFVKPKIKMNKKIFYFMKRNMKLDYYYQLVNHML